MSDARWNEVEEDVTDAILHFSMAVRMHEDNDGDQNSPSEYAAYKDNMALMHAMQCGYTSFENAMLRILDMLQEQAPTGESWHKDLVSRVSKALNDRPAILDPRIAAAANTTRSFRNLAGRGYRTFDVDRCAPAIAAARVMINGLSEAITEFRQSVDRPSNG